jgi:polyisoprenoid-binding protein YceI
MYRKLLSVVFAIGLLFLSHNQGRSAPIARVNRAKQSSSVIKFYVDPSHSSISFKVPFMGLAKVAGRFDNFFGEIYYDENNIENSSVEVTARAGSIDTRIRRRDRDLRRNYLEVQKYPAIRFRSNQIWQKGGKHTATGMLTLHGVSRQVEAPFEILKYLNSEKSREMGLVVGPIVINRNDFGITTGDLPGDEIEFEVLLRLRQAREDREDLHPEIEMTRSEMEPFEGIYQDSTGEETLYIQFMEDKLTSRSDPNGTILWNMLYEIVPYNNTPDKAEFRFLNHNACYVRFDKSGETLTFKLEGNRPLDS